MARGGKRAGAGRPKKTEAQRAAPPVKSKEIRAAIAKIDGWSDDLLGKLKELADGVYYEHPQFHKVYRSIPDRQALIYLIDRRVGRPTE